MRSKLNLRHLEPPTISIFKRNEDSIEVYVLEDEYTEENIVNFVKNFEDGNLV